MNLTGRAPYQKGMKPAKSAPIRNAANGKTCTLAIPGVCVGGTESTVFAHLRMFNLAGAAQKPDDLFGIDACHACHAHQERHGIGADSLIDAEDILRALIKTQQSRRAAGLISLANET